MKIANKFLNRLVSSSRACV